MSVVQHALLINTAIRPNSGNYIDQRRLKAPQNSISFVKKSSKRVIVSNRTRIRLSLEEQSLPQPSKVDVQRLVETLYEDLPHFFDDQGIDQTAYDEHVKFQDPITRQDSISGFLFNIAMLKLLFSPNIQVHWVRQTGTYEITARWTTDMTFSLLPWKPLLVLTGTSVIGINPENGKFCSHVDYWDSIKNNEYFSSEGLMDIIKQLQICKTPDLETPKYQILKRTADYEVRKYSPFLAVETKGYNLAGSTGFNEVAGLPDPNKDVSMRSVQGGVAAVLKFSGITMEDIVRKKEQLLRSSLLSDGLKPEDGYLLARYSDPGRIPSFMMTNEVLIWLEEFVLD